MEFSNQFKESFRYGVIAGYCFAATFVIVFYLSYFLPIQLIKIWKIKIIGHKKTVEMSKLLIQDFGLEKIKEVCILSLVHLSFWNLDYVQLI
ncbi:unnamed protein product [Trifolium pratense]|uniref:Uncharacterized protein n=1 Tax=Trifolium pratense TaxID=57577 RepID=A0ACB0JXE2_TRIPR|nr:unnamed protein product [Trifolium pratense]